MARQYFLRFVLVGRSRTRPKEGVFEGAYELAERVGILDHDKEALRSPLTWFEEHLDTPDRFSRTTSKGAYRRQTKWPSWFKPGAIEAVRKMGELMELLGRHGYTVEELRTMRPGFITFEDELQVVAEPFADTPHQTASVSTARGAGSTAQAV